MAENPSKTDIAPNPPHVDPPSPPPAMSPPSPPPHNAPAPALGPTADQLAAASAAASAAVPAARIPRTLADVAGTPTGPRLIPTNVDTSEGNIPDPPQIRPTRVMGGLAFYNDRVEPGSTPLTPDHVNPAATPEQRRASMIKMMEEADLAERRLRHDEVRPRIEEELTRRDADEAAAKAAGAR